MADCRHCKYAEWDYDDAYGGTVWWVDGCKLEDNDKSCHYDEYEEDDDGRTLYSI